MERRWIHSGHGLAFTPEMPVGGMIEAPTALSADAFARELDFLPIGTNDLIQHTLAVDRIDDEVNYLYNPLHPSILRLIQVVIDAGNRANIPVGMCGEMAGDPHYLPLLLGMGLREFSMQSGSLLEIKRRLQTLDCSELTRQTQQLMEQLDEERSADLIAKICNHTY